MAAKKDMWVCYLTQAAFHPFNVELYVKEVRVLAASNSPHTVARKRDAIDLAINTARTLYYNTVLGTNLPLDPRVSTTYQFNKSPKIHIVQRGYKLPPLTNTYLTTPTEAVINMPYGVVDYDKSREVAGDLLDKINTRYAKYIEDEEYWQDIFRKQAEQNETKWLGENVEAHDK